MFALVYGIIEAGVKGWGDPRCWAIFALAFVLLAIFAFVESRTEEPMMPLYLFKNLSFSGASIALAMVMFSLAGSMFFVSQYMQTILGYDTLHGWFRDAAGGGRDDRRCALVGERQQAHRHQVHGALGLALLPWPVLYGMTYKIDTPYITDC